MLQFHRPMHVMKNILNFFILLLIFSCSSDQTTSENIGNDDVFEAIINPSGTYAFFHGGQNRTYHYYQPLNFPENSPLIFVLHGYNANAEDFMDWLPMKELAEEQGFAVVYPQGLNDNTGKTHWNAGLTISNVDDVGFLSELALHLHMSFKLNPERTFISGFSNGGFMSYETVVKTSEIFRAAASIQGTMSLETWNNRSSAKPISILQLSGGLDRIVPVHGLNSTFGGWGGAPPILDIIEFWAELNQTDTLELIEQNETKIRKYSNSENGNEVWYYLIESLEHKIPLGEDYNVHTPTLIWEFFSNF